jgi:chromosome segregation ATPase
MAKPSKGVDFNHLTQKNTSKSNSGEDLKTLQNEHKSLQKQHIKLQNDLRISQTQYHVIFMENQKLIRQTQTLNTNYQSLFNDKEKWYSIASSQFHLINTLNAKIEALHVQNARLAIDKEKDAANIAKLTEEIHKANTQLKIIQEKHAEIESTLKVAEQCVDLYFID